MFPGLGGAGIDPRRMKAMLRQLGIKSEEIQAKRVVFELDNGKIVVEHPQVTAIDMQGKKTYTVMGEPKEESANVDTEGETAEIPDSDVSIVAEQAKVPVSRARKALEETHGDIAEAIQKLTKQ